MKPEKAYTKLQKLLAETEAAAPAPGTDRDSPAFAAFMRANRAVETFIARHGPTLEALREPRQDVTPERFRERLAEMDTELDWLEAHAAEAGNTGPVQEAYSAAWIDRMAFAANYDPEIGPDPEPDLEIG